jgi:hypothetical protein
MRPSRNGTTVFGPKKKGRNVIEKSPVKNALHLCGGEPPENGKSKWTNSSR